MTDRDQPYGIILAAQRARWWLPRLGGKNGKVDRAVVSALVLFVEVDGTASPTAPQLAEATHLHVQTVRVALRRLSEKGGPLAKIGERPVYSDDGDRYKGGRVGVYAIAPTDRLGDQLEIDFIEPSEPPGTQLGHRMPSESPGAQLGNGPSESDGGPNRAWEGSQVSPQTRAIEELNVEENGASVPRESPDAQLDDSLAARFPRGDDEPIADWLARLSAAGTSGIRLGPTEPQTDACLEGLHDLRRIGDGWSRCKACDLTIPDALAEMSA